MHTVQSASALEAIVGERPPTALLKSISFLDEHCITFLAASPLSVIGVWQVDGFRSCLVHGVTPVDKHTLALPAQQADGLDDGSPVGLLALVPGYGETMRVNGRLRVGDGGDVTVAVEEAFLHCAKAIIRSKLWKPLPATPPSSDASWRDVLACAPFVTLASVDSRGDADVSPKGDPAGFIHVIDDATIVIPDRPGNRRTDTLHNLVDDPHIGIVAFVPGDDRVVELRGRARVTDDAAMRAPLEVNGKVPAAAIVVDLDHVEVRRDAALVASQLWDQSLQVETGVLPKATCIWADHVKASDLDTAEARAAKDFITAEVLDPGNESDYANNLY